MEHEKGRAAIWEFDRATGRGRVFAGGLRNPVGMAWWAQTLWTSVNERDELGDDLVPDYLTSVREGGFYGWPYSYFGQHVDERVKPQRPELVAKAIKPDYALGAHTASLGLASAQESTLPEPFKEGMFVGQHGSWNRKPPSGYKVIFVPFAGGQPTGLPIDVLTGFLDENGDARGRPVGVAIDKTGALLVADDVGNVIWRVSAADHRPLAAGRVRVPELPALRDTIAAVAASSSRARPAHAAHPPMIGSERGHTWAIWWGERPPSDGLRRAARWLPSSRPGRSASPARQAPRIAPRPPATSSCPMEARSATGFVSSSSVSAFRTTPSASRVPSRA